MTFLIKAGAIITIGAWCSYEIIKQLKWIAEYKTDKTTREKVLSVNIAFLWIVLWIAATIQIVRF